jgi:hypothetical protein
MPTYLEDINMAKKITSAKMAKLAAKVLHKEYMPTAEEAKALAACVLSQREHIECLVNPAPAPEPAPAPAPDAPSAGGEPAPAT